MSTIRDSVEKEEAMIVWTNKENQLADFMNKQGASQKALLGMVVLVKSKKSKTTLCVHLDGKI